MPDIGEGFGELVKWFIPPPGHDANVEYLWRWRLGVFGCLSFTGVAFLYLAMVLEWGLPIVRPASAQTVQRQITAAKSEITTSIQAVQSKVKEVSDNQKDAAKAAADERVERLDQQLFWFRVQNCHARGQAKTYTAEKLNALRANYLKLTGTEWTPPNCADIGG